MPRAPHQTLLQQTIVIDARAHMLGRLASIVAKQVLAGHQIVSGWGFTGECNGLLCGQSLTTRSLVRRWWFAARRSPFLGALCARG
jgi:hypothetical protein